MAQVRTWLGGWDGSAWHDRAHPVHTHESLSTTTTTITTTATTTTTTTTRRLPWQAQGAADGDLWQLDAPR